LALMTPVNRTSVTGAVVGLRRPEYNHPIRRNRGSLDDEWLTSFNPDRGKSRNDKFPRNRSSGSDASCSKPPVF
jgi:hypothetical protein